MSRTRSEVFRPLITPVAAALKVLSCLRTWQQNTSLIACRQLEEGGATTNDSALIGSDAPTSPTELSLLISSLSVLNKQQI